MSRLVYLDAGGHLRLLGSHFDPGGIIGYFGMMIWISWEHGWWIGPAVLVAGWAVNLLTITVVARWGTVERR